MLMHSPASRPLARLFPPAEHAAALWACTCALLLLERAVSDGDAEADALRSLLPTLPAAVEALKADSVRPEHVPAISAALVGVCRMPGLMPGGLWAALVPPPLADLEAARARALSLDAGPELRAVQA